MKASLVCELREGFIREWQKDFPLVPPPPLRGIDQVEDGDVIDEWQAAGCIATLWGSVQAVNNKLDQLHLQIQRKQRVRDFLIRLLQTFDSEYEEKSSSLNLNTSTHDSSKAGSGNNNNNSNNNNNVNTISSDKGATIVTVTSDLRRVTPSEGKVYTDKSGVLCVPDECAPAEVCNDNNSPSNAVPCRKTNTCEKSCSTELKCSKESKTSFNNSCTVDIGVQCDIGLKFYKDEGLGGDGLVGYKSVIDHKVGRECHGRCVTVTTSRRHRVTSGNTEVCGDSGGEDSSGGGNYVDEEIHYDNNWVLKEHNATMFGKRKKGGSGRHGDEGGSMRSNKDNFMAVTSQRQLAHQDDSLGHQSNTDISGSSGSISSVGSFGRGTNPSTLTRNFQLLKLTSGFDLVLDDSDGNSSTDEHSGRGDKTKSSQTQADKKDGALKDLFNKNSNIPTSVKDKSDCDNIDKSEDNNGDDDDDDTTPTCGDFQALKFHYDSGDVSTVLDGNPPDLVSSTLSNTTMINTQTKPGDGHATSNDQPSTPSPNSTIVRNDSKRSSGGPPPPVAKKPSRPSTGKKLPTPPVGVEPVTRPKRDQFVKTNTTTPTEPVPIQPSPPSLRQNYASINNNNNNDNDADPSSNANPASKLTNPIEIDVTSPTDMSESMENNNNNDNNDNNDPKQAQLPSPKLRSPSTSSSTSFLSSSPDFRASLAAGIIPATPNADVVIGQSNPKRQSNFYCDLDLDPDSLSPSRTSRVHSNSDSEGHNLNCLSPKSAKDEDSDDSGDEKRNSLSNLVHGTNPTMILISLADSSYQRSFSSSSQNNEEVSGDQGEKSGANESETVATSPPQLSQSSSTPSPSPRSDSPPPPPIPKRESIVSNNRLHHHHHQQRDGERFETTHCYDVRNNSEERRSINNNSSNNNNMIEVGPIDTTSKVDGPPPHHDSTSTTTTTIDSNQGEYSRMSSTDTLVDESQQPQPQQQQQHTRTYRRSESFTSDIDVKDAMSVFDQIISSQCPDLVEEQDSPLESQRSLRARRRSSSVINYENWTINRALTASISSRCRSESLTLEEFNFIDEGDGGENDTTTNDDDSSNASMPSPDLSRPGYISHGSKDSGLCDDISVSDSMHSELDNVEGRISLQQIQKLERWEEEEAIGMIDNIKRENATVTVTPSECVSDYDSVSLSSDFVYLSGSLAKKRQGNKASKRRGDGTAQHDEDDEEDEEEEDIEGREGRLDTSSTASSLEEGDGRSMNTSYDETDSGHEGMLKMRQLLIKGVLDSERTYLGILGLLIHYKKNMEASSKTSKPVATDSDIQAIFGNIEKLHEIHTTFVTSLEAKVKAWSHAECVGEIFKIFILEFPEFSQYVNNYSNAVSTIHRCGQESETFQEIATHMTIKSAVLSSVKENIKLEDALFKPVQRVQRNSLVLHDLIKYTPEDHPDYNALQKALKLSQHNLETFAAVVPHASTNHENRRLVKSSFLVELVNGVRKLRYMFLFNDILVCTKRETHRNNKVSFQIKWFAPLANMTYDTKFAYKDDTKFSKKDDISELKNKIKVLKREMKNEMKKFDEKDKHRSLVIGGATRAVEKLRKKVLQYEGQLILASPKLPFKVSLERGKVYTLLMTTDYEKEEWKEALNTLCKRGSQRDPLGAQQPPFSSIFVQDLIDSVKETPQVNKIGNVLLQKDEEILTGTLNVTIHKMNGLTQECDTYCCLEMDSFGHFFMMARTKMCEASRDPNWNEDFELELEASMTLRILCFMKAEGVEGDQLLGRGALELDKHWLKGSFQEKTISMNDISLVVSVRHTPAEKTMQRTPSRTRSAVFGVEISSCARREGKTVPTIITACIKEVEKRGLDEVGIYRVSGVTSDLQRTKKLFDRNISAGASSLEDIDINAVTGSLKLYLRELPEPLFTEAAYQKFVGTLKLSDEEAKSECILRLLHELPDTNYYTIVCLLEHLVKVARYVGENKMSIHNLSTIFGPTLLAPAAKASTNNDPLAMMWQGAEQVMQQSGVVSYLLSLAVSGRSLRRSSS